MALSGQEFDRQCNSLYFKPYELIRQPNFDTFPRFFNAAFFSYLNFFRDLEDCDNLLTVFLLCDLAIETKYHQLNFERSLSTEKTTENDLFWAHLLTLGIMFTNRHNSQNEQERDSDGKNQRSINLVETFGNKAAEIRLVKKKTAVRIFDTGSSWSDQELLLRLNKEEVDIYAKKEDEDEGVRMSDIDRFFECLVPRGRETHEEDEWSFLKDEWSFLKDEWSFLNVDYSSH